MHDETDIIGHMISSAAMAEDGAIINELPLPEKMDLVTSAVIYKTWGDPDQSSRVNDLIAKIDEGQLAVSMECVFRNFDYAVVEPDGSQKVIARDENSAFLTKHLRAYGGTGSYEGYKIGRLLRDLYFSGKGLVDKPANPRSVILPKEVNPFKPVDTFSTLAMEVVMPEDNSVQLAEVTALKEALSTEKTTASTLATEIGTHKATIASLETKVNELEATIATISQEKLTLSQEIQKMVSEVKAAARKNALVTAGATEDKATELLSKFADATDEMFDVVVALIVKPTPVADTESVEVEVETETEALETVTEVDEPAVVVVEDSVADKISVASQWLRASVLQSTKNSK
jgi:outer membrane murein-binding lipoprotein Lpp